MPDGFFFEFADEQLPGEGLRPAFLESWIFQLRNDTKMSPQLKSSFFIVASSLWSYLPFSYSPKMVRQNLSYLVARRLGPAEERESSVGSDAENRQKGGGQRPPARPEVAMVRVVQQVVLLCDVVGQRKDAAKRHAVPVQPPPEPPLVNVVVCRDKQRLPRAGDKYSFKEDLKKKGKGSSSQSVAQVNQT